MKLKFVFGHMMMFFYYQREGSEFESWNKICDHMGMRWDIFDYVEMVPRKNTKALDFFDVTAWMKSFKLIKL